MATTKRRTPQRPPADPVMGALEEQFHYAVQQAARTLAREVARLVLARRRLGDKAR